MSPEILLLLLRLLSGVVLLIFFGALGWLLLQEMQVTARALDARQQAFGQLRLLAGQSETAVVDTLYPLLPVTSLGRAPSNTIVVEDSYASNEHALLRRRGDQWLLEDLQSRNGTLLNDVPLAETAVLSSGDVITIGDTALRVELGTVNDANES